MKTTLDLPAELYKKAKRYAARRKRSFKDLMIEALKRIVAEADQSMLQPEWKHCWGRFRGSTEETEAIQQIIDNDLSKISEEDWR
jgi:hypothetical protein